MIKFNIKLMQIIIKLFSLNTLCTLLRTWNMYLRESAESVQIPRLVAEAL